MCGRFENKVVYDDLMDLFNFEEVSEKNETGQFNIAPTQKIMAVMLQRERYSLVEMNWGIKFRDDTPLIFNSRLETIKEKPYWSGLFDKNRCIVPMTAFYEWKSEEGRKVPYRIYLTDEKYFFVPAVYVQKNNEYYASLITTTPNSFIKKIHHRMPVILRKDEAAEFLSNSLSENFDICLPYKDADSMRMERIAL